MNKKRISTTKDSRIVLFDFFGLFAADPFVTYFLRHYEEGEGMRIKNYFCQGADLGKISYPELLLKMRDEIGLIPDEVDKEIKEVSKLRPETVEYAKSLKERHPVHLLSNCMPGMFDALFQGTEFFSCFDKLYLSYELKMIKPGDEIFQYVLKDIGHYDQIVFLDDNPENVLAARKNGIPAIQFIDLEQAKRELEALGY